MDHLAERGINCPRPIHGRDGQALRTLAGKPAAITSFLQGMWPRRMTVQHCGPVGAALAALHLAGRDFAIRRPNALSVSGWRPLFGGARDHIDPERARELTAELDFFVKPPAWRACVRSRRATQLLIRETLESSHLCRKVLAATYPPHPPL